MPEKSSKNIVIEFWDFIDHPSVPETFLRELQNVFKDLPIDGRVLGSLSNSYPDAATCIPHVVFVDQTKKLSLQTEQHLQKIQGLDPHLVVIRMVEELPTGANVRRYLSNGNQFFIQHSADLDKIRDPLIEILSERFRTHFVRNVRVPARHKIIIHLASIEQALVAETLNIGKGGLFIRGAHPHIQKDDLVEFELEMRSNSHLDTPIEPYDPIEAMTRKTSKKPVCEQGTLLSGYTGLGTVAWIRYHSESPSAPVGLGLRFQTLSPSVEKLINKYLQNAKNNIPNS